MSGEIIPDGEPQVFGRDWFVGECIFVGEDGNAIPAEAFIEPSPMVRSAAMIANILESLQVLGVPLIACELAQPSYRTEPIEGAELGGQPRNPETDVIDEIDRLVDWQLEKGKR
jgi:hypothetical protein